jgi:cytoskeletal protein CcmA (bactofilin family)
MLRIGRGSKNETMARNAHDPAQDARQTTGAQATHAAPPATPTATPTATPMATPNAQSNMSRAEMQQAATRPTPVAFASQAERPVQVEQGATVSRAVTESESLARAVKDGGVGGFVGGASALTGEINFKGMMRVDGQLSGRVRSQDGTLIVSSGGRVEAEVFVAVAKINGTVEGDITATVRVELGRTARVAGNVETPALVVEEGAIFEGSCRMTNAAVASSPARVKNAA